MNNDVLFYANCVVMQLAFVSVLSIRIDEREQKNALGARKRSYLRFKMSRIDRVRAGIDDTNAIKGTWPFMLGSCCILGSRVPSTTS